MNVSLESSSAQTSCFPPVRTFGLVQSWPIASPAEPGLGQPGRQRPQTAPKGRGNARPRNLEPRNRAGSSGRLEVKGLFLAFLEHRHKCPSRDPQRLTFQNAAFLICKLMSKGSRAQQHVFEGVKLQAGPKALRHELSPHRMRLLHVAVGQKRAPKMEP